MMRVVESSESRVLDELVTIEMSVKEAAYLTAILNGDCQSEAVRQVNKICLLERYKQDVLSVNEFEMHNVLDDLLAAKGVVE